MQTQATLKQAVEQQLDLILKIEDERKLLKKENRILKEEHQKMLNILRKYNQQKIDTGINTEDLSQKPNQQQLQSESKQVETLKQTKDQSVQVDLDPTFFLNNSKLSSVQELLRQANNSMSIGNIQLSKCQEKTENIKLQQTKRTNKTNNNQQVAGEIVKMSKEIAALKKELKDSENRGKIKEKEFRDLKKCLQVKSQALQKSRKQFNQLSQVFNNDKFKSIKILQNQAGQLRVRNAMIEQQASLSSKFKSALEQVTEEYQSYRFDREGRIQRLVIELKQKSNRCDQLQRELINYR